MRATAASHVYGRTGEQVMQDGTSMKRRLAAILAADIAGYSRLMAPTNCAGTVREGPRQRWSGSAAT